MDIKSAETTNNISDIYKRIQAFGPLRFSEQHHPWVRHFRIELMLNKEKKTIIVRFIGACTEFETYTMKPTENILSAAAVQAKNELENYLYSKFLSIHFLDGNNNIFNMTEETYRIGGFVYQTGVRESVKLDYEFHVASLQIPSQ